MASRFKNSRFGCLGKTFANASAPSSLTLLSFKSSLSREVHFESASASMMAPSQKKREPAILKSFMPVAFATIAAM